MKHMTDLDTNVSNYSLSELLTISNIQDDDLNETQILTNTNKLINKFKEKDPKLCIFFKEVQDKLLNYVQDLDHSSNNDNDDDTANTKNNVEGFTDYSKINPYITGWSSNEFTPKNKNVLSKITQRQNTTRLFDNSHVPATREQIETTDTYNLPVKQDSLNPNLKNTISRFVNLDSQFRQYTTGTESNSTNYTSDLSDTLKDVISLSLYSYQIPFSWYAIDTAYGNTCFWIVDKKTNIAIPVSVPSGNYTQTSFQSQLNSSFLLSGFSFPAYVSPLYNIPVNSPVYYNNNNGKITMFLNNGTFSDPLGKLSSFDIGSDTTIIFYDFTGILQCNTTCANITKHFLNNTLGWLMGYKLPYIIVSPDGNEASSILDLNGTKYLVLSIDDYNQNHLNESLVSITQYSNVLKIPPYYSSDIPYTCSTPSQTGNNLEQIMNQLGFENSQNGLLIADKYENDYTSTQIVLPSAPRTLTKSQLYTINEINRNNNNLTHYLAKAPTTSDILGILPVKTSTGVPTGSLLVELSGSLQNISRTYFGPVNIERMSIKLLDDKGNILNLNGNDWCVTLIGECLYQY